MDTLKRNIIWRAASYLNIEAVRDSRHHKRIVHYSPAYNAVDCHCEGRDGFVTLLQNFIADRVCEYKINPRVTSQLPSRDSFFSSCKISYATETEKWKLNSELYRI